MPKTGWVPRQISPINQQAYISKSRNLWAKGLYSYVLQTEFCDLFSDKLQLEPDIHVHADWQGEGARGRGEGEVALQAEV